MSNQIQNEIVFQLPFTGFPREAKSPVGTECFLNLPPEVEVCRVISLQGMDFVLIGRRRENTLCLNDLKCSRFHCELSRENDQHWAVHDLHSQNGTYVNGLRLACKYFLHDGDVIRVGDTEIIFTLTTPTA